MSYLTLKMKNYQRVSCQTQEKHLLNFVTTESSFTFCMTTATECNSFFRQKWVTLFLMKLFTWGLAATPKEMSLNWFCTIGFAPNGDGNEIPVFRLSTVSIIPVPLEPDFFTDGQRINFNSFLLY